MQFINLVWIVCCAVNGQTTTTQPVSEAVRLEREVMDNIRAQPVGSGTVDDLNLPEEFRRRIADRALRVSYEQRFRIVVPDAAPQHVATTTPTGPAIPATAPTKTTSPSGRVVWSSGGMITILIIAMAARRKRRKNP